jgi:hypothetical protein
MQDADFADILVIVVSAGLTFGSYALMKKPLTDVLPWFSDEPVFVLEGWGFWDYLKFSVFVTGIFALVLEVLCYDRTAVDRSEKKKNDGPDTLLGACVGFVVGLLLIIGVIYGLYSLIGLFVSSVPYRIVILAILFAFLQKGESGSAMARTFWTALPNVYIGLCILQALDLQWAILLLIVEMIIVLPLTVLRHFQH